MDPQISLFNNFFIKNESHGTIYTFKNYFTTIFFNFQFSIVSKWTLNSTSLIHRKRKKQFEYATKRKKQNKQKN